MNMFQQLTSNVIHLFFEDHQKTETLLLINGKPNLHPLLWSFPFLVHQLVKLLDAEDITNEKVSTLVLPLEINNVTSKLESSVLNSEIMTQMLMLFSLKKRIPLTKVNPNFLDTVIFVLN